MQDVAEDDSVGRARELGLGLEEVGFYEVQISQASRGAVGMGMRTNEADVQSSRGVDEGSLTLPVLFCRL